MNTKVEQIFAQWLTLNEDEKRDFIKELFYFNNLNPDEKKNIEAKYLKKSK